MFCPGLPFYVQRVGGCEDSRQHVGAAHQVQVQRARSPRFVPTLAPEHTPRHSAQTETRQMSSRLSSSRLTVRTHWHGGWCGRDGSEGCVAQLARPARGPLWPWPSPRSPPTNAHLPLSPPTAQAPSSTPLFDAFTRVRVLSRTVTRLASSFSPAELDRGHPSSINALPAAPPNLPSAPPVRVSGSGTSSWYVLLSECRHTWP